MQNGGQWGRGLKAEPEADAAFLTELTERMQLSKDTDELLWQAVNAIARYFALTRCFFIEIDEREDTFRVYRDFRHADSLRSTAGTYSNSVCPPQLISALKAERVVAIDDTAADAITAAYYSSAYAPFDARAFVAVPLLRRGSRVAALGAALEGPHTWTSRETSLLHASAEHVWNALEARRLDSQLRESELRFRGLTSHAPVGIFETDVGGQCIFVNEKWCALAGMNPEAARGNGWVTAIHHADREGVFAAWRAATAAGRKFSGEYQFCTPDGRISWVQGSASALRNPAGVIDGFIGTVTDITEQKLSEQRLANSSHRLQLVTDALPALISYVDADGRYQFTNQAYVDWFGHARDEINGRHMREVLGEEAFVCLQAHVEQALAGRRVQFEAEIPYKDAGLRFVHADYVPDVQAEGTVAGFYALITDISPRKRAEDHTLMLLREVNHRAKNMLSVVQALARQTGRDVGAKAFAEQFSARLSGLSASHDLLVSSDWRGVELEQLIRSQVSLLGDIERSRILMDGPRIRLSAAAAQIIGMAMHELAANAVRFGALCTETGTIGISWELGDFPAPRFRMAWVERSSPQGRDLGAKGFGHTGMIQMVERGLHASVSLAYAPAGLEWRMEAPARSLLEQG